jgi:hypothetical protein
VVVHPESFVIPSGFFILIGFVISRDFFIPSGFDISDVSGSFESPNWLIEEAEGLVHIPVQMPSYETEFWPYPATCISITLVTPTTTMFKISITPRTSIRVVIRMLLKSLPFNGL